MWWNVYVSSYQTRFSQYRKVSLNTFVRHVSNIFTVYHMKYVHCVLYLIAYSLRMFPRRVRFSSLRYIFFWKNQHIHSKFLHHNGNQYTDLVRCLECILCNRTATVRICIQIRALPITTIASAAKCLYLFWSSLWSFFDLSGRCLSGLHSMASVVQFMQLIQRTMMRMEFHAVSCNAKISQLTFLCV
jgi:hypothetical protein